MIYRYFSFDVRVAVDIAEVEVWFRALVRRVRFLLFGVFD
jgi:hypothetical protein